MHEDSSEALVAGIAETVQTLKSGILADAERQRQERADIYRPEEFRKHVVELRRKIERAEADINECSSKPADATPEPPSYPTLAETQDEAKSIRIDILLTELEIFTAEMRKVDTTDFAAIKEALSECVTTVKRLTSAIMAEHPAYSSDGDLVIDCPRYKTMFDLHALQAHFMDILSTQRSAQLMAELDKGIAEGEARLAAAAAASSLGVDQVDPYNRDSTSPYDEYVQDDEVSDAAAASLRSRDGVTNPAASTVALERIRHHSHLSFGYATHALVRGSEAKLAATPVATAAKLWLVFLSSLTGAVEGGVPMEHKLVPPARYSLSAPSETKEMSVRVDTPTYVTADPFLVCQWAALRAASSVVRCVAAGGRCRVIWTGSGAPQVSMRFPLSAHVAPHDDVAGALGADLLRGSAGEGREGGDVGRLGVSGRGVEVAVEDVVAESRSLGTRKHNRSFRRYSVLNQPAKPMVDLPQLFAPAPLQAPDSSALVGGVGVGSGGADGTAPYRKSHSSEVALADKMSSSVGFSGQMHPFEADGAFDGESDVPHDEGLEDLQPPPAYLQRVSSTMVNEAFAEACATATRDRLFALGVPQKGNAVPLPSQEPQVSSDGMEAVHTVSADRVSASEAAAPSTARTTAAGVGVDVGGPTADAVAVSLQAVMPKLQWKGSVTRTAVDGDDGPGSEVRRFEGAIDEGAAADAALLVRAENAVAAGDYLAALKLLAVPQRHTHSRASVATGTVWGDGLSERFAAFDALYEAAFHTVNVTSTVPPGDAGVSWDGTSACGRAVVPRDILTHEAAAVAEVPLVSARAISAAVGGSLVERDVHVVASRGLEAFVHPWGDAAAPFDSCDAVEAVPLVTLAYDSASQSNPSGEWVSRVGEYRRVDVSKVAESRVESPFGLRGLLSHRAEWCDTHFTAPAVAPLGGARGCAVSLLTSGAEITHADAAQGRSVKALRSNHRACDGECPTSSVSSPPLLWHAAAFRIAFQVSLTSDIPCERTAVEKNVARVPAAAVSARAATGLCAFLMNSTSPGGATAAATTRGVGENTITSATAEQAHPTQTVSAFCRRERRTDQPHCVYCSIHSCALCLSAKFPSMQFCGGNVCALSVTLRRKFLLPPPIVSPLPSLRVPQDLPPCPPPLVLLRLLARPPDAIVSTLGNPAHVLSTGRTSSPSYLYPDWGVAVTTTRSLRSPVVSSVRLFASTELNVSCGIPFRSYAYVIDPNTSPKVAMLCTPASAEAERYSDSATDDGGKGEGAVPAADGLKSMLELTFTGCGRNSDKDSGADDDRGGEGEEGGPSADAGKVDEGAGGGAPPSRSSPRRTTSAQVGVHGRDRRSLPVKGPSRWEGRSVVVAPPSGLSASAHGTAPSSGVAAFPSPSSGAGMPTEVEVVASLTVKDLSAPLTLEDLAEAWGSPYARTATTVVWLRELRSIVPPSCVHASLSALGFSSQVVCTHGEAPSLQCDVLSTRNGVVTSIEISLSH